MNCIEFRKTKTNVIPLTNRKRRKQQNSKANSKQTDETGVKPGKTRANKTRLVLLSLKLVEKMA